MKHLVNEVKMMNVLERGLLIWSAVIVLAIYQHCFQLLAS